MREFDVVARTNDVALTVRLPADLHDRLVQRAAKEDRTVASLLRMAAWAYLKAK